MYLIFLDVDYGLCITWIMRQKLWGDKVEEKIYLGVRDRKRLNITALLHRHSFTVGITTATYAETWVSVSGPFREADPTLWASALEAQ